MTIMRVMTDWSLFCIRQFFSSMVACFATNFLISAINGDPTKLTDPGLVRFNAFKFVSSGQYY